MKCIEYFMNLKKLVSKLGDRRVVRQSSKYYLHTPLILRVANVHL